jgi:hypothetical protein
MNFHIRADYEFGNDERTNPSHPLGQGQRLRITNQVDVRLAATQTGEAVDSARGRPSGRIGRIRNTLDRHRSAFPATSGTQRLVSRTSPATPDMPVYEGRQLIHSQCAESAV